MKTILSYIFTAFIIFGISTVKISKVSACQFDVDIKLLKSGSSYYGLCFDNEGNIVISEVSSDVLIKVDKAGNFVDQISSPTLDAFGMVYRQDDSMFIADGASFKIFKGTWPGGFALFSDDYQYPRGMVRNGNDIYGAVHTYGPNAGRIYKIDEFDNMLDVLEFGSGLSDIAFDSYQSIFITDYVDNKVYKIDTDLNLTVYLDELQTPYGIVVDENDNVIFTDRDALGGSIMCASHEDSFVVLAKDLNDPRDIILSANKFYFTTSNGLYEMQLTPIAQNITVTYPDGGEELFGREVYQITWSSEGNIEHVRIEYSINNGVDWIEIVDNTVNDGSYSWEVPCTNSDESLLRVSDANDGVSDVSDAVFSISCELPPIGIDAIIEFFNKSVADASLTGVGKNPWLVKLRLFFMREMLVIAKELIEHEKTGCACLTLERASLRCDGDNRPPDFVKGEAVPQLNNMISELMEQLGCEEISKKRCWN